MFKWVCLGVAVVALAAFGWMLNDMRLEVKGLGQKAEKLTVKTEALVDKVDKQLPPLLAQAEKATNQLDKQLPRILAETEQAGKALSTHLPTLLKRTETLLEHSEVAVDNLAEVSSSFKQYKGLLGLVHASINPQSKGLLGYATSMLGLLGSHKEKATIGVKTSGSGDALKGAVPVKEWAAAAQKDAHFLSLVSKSKEDVLHGLSRTGSSAPLHIKVADQPPRLLSEWLKENHKESKGGE